MLHSFHRLPWLGRSQPRRISSAAAPTEEERVERTRFSRNVKKDKTTVYFEVEDFVERMREKKRANKSKEGDKKAFKHEFYIKDNKLAATVDPCDEAGGVKIEIRPLPCSKAEVFCRISLGSGKWNTQEFLHAKDSNEVDIILRLGKKTCWMIKKFNRFLETDGVLKLKIDIEITWCEDLKKDGGPPDNSAEVIRKEDSPSKKDENKTEEEVSSSSFKSPGSAIMCEEKEEIPEVSRMTVREEGLLLQEESETLE